jgi:hypothetical protein
VAVRLGLHEDVVLVGVNGGSKVGVQGHINNAVHELGGAEVLEPALGALHAVQRSNRAVWEGDGGSLGASCSEVAFAKHAEAALATRLSVDPDGTTDSGLVDPDHGSAVVRGTLALYTCAVAAHGVVDP